METTHQDSIAQALANGTGRHGRERLSLKGKGRASGDRGKGRDSGKGKPKGKPGQSNPGHSHEKLLRQCVKEGRFVRIWFNGMEGNIKGRVTEFDAFTLTLGDIDHQGETGVIFKHAITMIIPLDEGVESNG